MIIVGNILYYLLIFQEEFEHAMDMSGTEFGLLYSFYSFPNMIIPIIGGKPCYQIKQYKNVGTY